MRTVNFIVRVTCDGDIDKTKEMVREQLMESGPWQGNARVRVESFRSTLDEFRLRERFLEKRLAVQDGKFEEIQRAKVISDDAAARRLVEKTARMAEHARITSLPKVERLAAQKQQAADRLQKESAASAKKVSDLVAKENAGTPLSKKESGALKILKVLNLT